MEETQSFYAYRSEGGRKSRKMIYLHREISKTPKGMDCDHIDHDTLNCQEYNLRNLTRSQNNMNRKTQSNNRLGEKGIRQHGSGFQVRVVVGGKCVYNKTLRTLVDAVLCRNNALREYHGEYAYIPSKESE